MYSTLVNRTISISFVLLILATTSYSQDAKNRVAGSDAPLSATPVSTPTPPLQVLYAGKLMGYFRSPSLQSGASKDQNVTHPCPLKAQDEASPIAKSFLQTWDPAKTNLILVGTGDNFAPQLEARTFDPARKPELKVSMDKYQPANKELYSWYSAENRWIPVEEVQSHPDLEEQYARGEGIIPTDNVGCFLSAAGFVAVVPGKHDFYFGADRVRQLARFLAKMDQPGYQPVQMLAANLIIKTVRVSGGSPPVSNSKWPEGFTVNNLKTFYPWSAPVIKITLAKSAPDEFTNWESGISICRADKDDKITSPNCKKISKTQIAGTGNSFSLTIPPDPSLRADPNLKPPTFVPGNYGLCLRTSAPGEADNSDQNCLRFSVNTPFLNSPIPKASTSYIDPEPFVFLPKNEQANRPHDVAIFGVVDPLIGEHVGVLNFSWLNADPNLKTTVSAEDAREALNQQLEYFKRWYEETHGGQPFSGLKILLAQMSPQRARLLAARFHKEFQIVVTAADQEQATNETDQRIVWTRNGPASAFIAVPQPAFMDSESQEVGVRVGTIKVSPIGDSWDLSWERCQSCSVQSAKTGKPVRDKLAERFNESMEKCLVHPDQKKPSLDLKLLTLCAMRERLAADVALIQQRDFFDQSPSAETDDTQRMLDRVIWKGDLLTLMYVTGASLKKALALSEKFRSDDNNLLSLADERNRKLEYVGIMKSGNEYLINEVPIDDKKIYAVATTDYIGAGDTGYSELAAAALDPKTRPGQFPAKLEHISAVVCRKLVGNGARQECVDEVNRDDYLDPSNAGAPSPKRPGIVERFWDKVPFRWPPGDTKPATTVAAVEQQAQQHPFWILSVRNFSLGFNGLTKNLTDAQVAQRFSGIPTSGVTARKNSTITAQIDTRLSRSSHANEFFVGLGADFKEQSTGDVTPSLLLINNRATADAGAIHALRGGRSSTRVGLAAYLHLETPLQKAFSIFTLSGSDRLRITQDRNLLVLPRLGLRWQHRGNSFEGGLEAGRELNAFVGYSFNTNGVVVSCQPNPAETFASCVNRLIKAGTVNKNSVASALLESRPRAGLYSRLNLTIPFNDKVKYVLSEEGDLFFNFHGDNSIDTRLRDISKHSLKFNVWPSFSIGPSLQILLYRNKVNGDFLFQRQFGFETSLSFDLFNRREKMVQIEHKP